VVKVKELQDAEWPLLPEGPVFFASTTCPASRSAPARSRTPRDRHRVRNAARRRGGFPLLAPMSAIAGRLAVEAGASSSGGGRSACLVLGAGHAGLAAAAPPQAIGSRVIVLTRSATLARRCEPPRGFVRASRAPQKSNARRCGRISSSGAVFVPAQPTPKLCRARSWPACAAAP
jgi:alanine dehydrogenase